MEIKVLSIGHAIPMGVRDEIKRRYPGARFFEVPLNLRFGESLVPQVKAAVEHALEISECRGQSPFVILPGVSVASAMVITMIHGIIGRFPFLIELSKDQEQRHLLRLKEVHDLDSIRNDARSRRVNHMNKERKEGE